MKLLQTSGLIVACASLFACASPIKNMPPHEAIQFGNNQFYEIPSYRMDMSSKLINMSINGAQSEKEIKEAEIFNKYFNFFGKSFIFNGTGIFDNVNDQYQIIPEYGYKAKNINASIRFPIILDRKAKALYADLSALDGIATNLNNVGKYSRFDLSKLPIPEGADKKLVDIMRKYTNLIFDKVPADAISEQPLNAEDRKVNAVRKLQLTIKPTDQLSLYPEMLNEMAAIVFPNPDKTQENVKQDTDKLSQEMSKLFSPESRDLYTIAFNRAGQIVSMKADSNYIINPKTDEHKHNELNSSAETNNPPKDGFQLHFITDMLISDIGKAKLIDPPTVENSADGMENIKHSPLSKLFLGKHDNTEDQTWQDSDTAVMDAAATVEPARKVRKSNKKKRR